MARKMIKPKKKVMAKKAGAKVKKKVAAKAKSKPKKVSFIPKGYASITPYLIVEGASTAIKFYQNVFGAKNVMRMDTPDGKVAHAELTIGDSKIMLSDGCPEMDMKGPKSYGGAAVSVHLYVKNVDEVVKKAVKEGAKLLQEVQDKFYGDRSGLIEDPFGHQWGVSTHVENVTPAKMKKRMQEQFTLNKA